MSADIASATTEPRYTRRDGRGMPFAGARLWPVAIIVAAAVLMMVPVLIYGPPNGHSLPFNINWHRFFADQFWQGDLYPRWLADMNGGAGSPVFFFYAPLPFYLSALVDGACGGCTPFASLGLSGVALLALSGVALYGFACGHAGKWAATIGALVYMGLPYHLEVNFWTRQAIGEFALYPLMPLALLCLDRMAGRRAPAWVIGLALAYAAMVATHLPGALLFSPFLALYGVMRLRRVRALLVAAGAVLCGIGIAGVYLLPALTLQEAITPEAWWAEYFQYQNWFLASFGPTANPELTNRLTWIAVAVSLAALIAVMLARRAGHAQGFGVWIVAIAGAWVLMTPVSQPLWAHLPLLAKVQFPWRAMIVIDLAAAVTIAMAVDRVWTGRKPADRKRLPIIGVVLAGAVLSGAPAFGRLDPLMDPNFIAFRDEAIARGVDTREYRPAWVGHDVEELPLLRQRLDDLPQGWADTGEATVAIDNWGPRAIDLTVTAETDTTVTVKQFYWLGWRARGALGAPVELSPSAPDGLVTFDLPAGRHVIELRLRPIWAEQYGSAISVVALLCLAALAAQVGFGGRAQRRQQG